MVQVLVRSHGDTLANVIGRHTTKTASAPMGAFTWAATIPQQPSRLSFSIPLHRVPHPQGKLYYALSSLSLCRSNGGPELNPRGGPCIIHST